MNTPLRAVLSALTGATLLLVASCTSSAPESEPSATASFTASAWVKPLESDSVAAPLSSASTVIQSVSAGTASPESSTAGEGDLGSDPDFRATPLPSGLSQEDQRRARESVDAFQKYWSLANQAAANPGDDWTGQIESVATGTAADELKKSVGELAAQGLSARGSTAVTVTVERVKDGEVELSTCVDGSKSRLLDSAGAVSNPDADYAQRTAGSAQVGEYTSGWKVSMNVFHMSTPC